MEKWQGKIAVVTGASAGIGAEVVKDLASNGLIVVGLARRAEKVQEIANEIGEISGEIHGYKCDVSELQSIKDAFKWIEERFGIVNILINNAGIGRKAMILNDDSEVDNQIQQVINTNFTGMVQVTRHAWCLIKKSDDYGMIININSVTGHRVPFPKDGKCNMNVYYGTKHAVTATTEVIRQELVCMKNSKIRISSLSPGVVETDFFHVADLVPADHNISDFLPSIKPADVSHAIRFLLSTPYNVNVSELTIKPVGEPDQF